MTDIRMALKNGALTVGSMLLRKERIMGAGYVIKCSSFWCRYKRELFAGIGMGFPQTYRELIEKAKAGLISEEHAEFLENNPKGALDAQVCIYRCSGCGHIYSDYVLDMYVPKEEDEDIPERERWSVANPAESIRYVMPYELAGNYRLYKKHSHHCPNCGEEAEVLDKIDHITGKCPNCGGELKADRILWD